MTKKKQQDLAKVKFDTRLVKFKTRLNQVVWSGLSAPEVKMLTVVLSDYRTALQHNPHTDMIEISYSDLRKRLHYTSNKHAISEYVWRLKKNLQGWREFSIGGLDTSFVLFPTIQRDENNKAFRFVLNPTLVNLLLFDSNNGNYVKYQEGLINSLSQVTSMTMLRLLKQYRSTGIAIFSKMTNTKNGKLHIGLWQQLEVNPNMRESDFVRRDLKPALIDIAPFFTHLDYKKTRGVVKGHSVITGYRFTFDKQPADYDDELEALTVARFQAIGLKNIESAICLTDNEKYKAVDKLLKQKIGTAKKQANKGKDVFSLDKPAKQLNLFSDDQTIQTKYTGPNLKFSSPKMMQTVKQADLKTLKEMEQKLTVFLQQKIKNKATNAYSDKVMDLLLIRRVIYARTQK